MWHRGLGLNLGMVRGLSMFFYVVDMGLLRIPSTV